jgi:hypothetical protein
MYESPIEMTISEIITDFKQYQEKQICEAIQRMNINISKEELIKALDYDRQQYEKGYNDAIEEFAERLKSKAVQKFDWNEYVEIEDIDNLRLILIKRRFYNEFF